MHQICWGIRFWIEFQIAQTNFNIILKRCFPSTKICIKKKSNHQNWSISYNQCLYFNCFICKLKMRWKSYIFKTIILWLSTLQLCASKPTKCWWIPVLYTYINFIPTLGFSMPWMKDMDEQNVTKDIAFIYTLCLWGAKIYTYLHYWAEFESLIVSSLVT